MERACNDFADRLEPLGFKRKNNRGRTWTRSGADGRACIHLHRSGCSYGSPRNNSIDIRVELSIEPLDPNAAYRGQLTSEQVRDARGYAYHLRFNAFTWSTYDRCIDDFERFIRERGLPWFKQHGV